MTRGKFTRRGPTWIVLGLFVAFFPFYLLLPFRILIELLNAVAVSVGFGVLVAYGQGIWNGYRRDGLTPGHFLAMGIFLSWLAVIIRLMLMWVWRITDWEGATDHWTMAFAVWMFVIGGALHLTARDAIDDHIPKSHWIWLSILVSMGVFMGLLVLRFTIR